MVHMHSAVESSLIKKIMNKYTWEPVVERPLATGRNFFFISSKLATRSPFIASLVILLGAAPITSFAADWYLKPVVKTKSDYDTNPRLLPVKPDDSVIGGILSAAMDLGVKTPVNEFSLRPRVRYADYHNDDGFLDTTDVFVDMFGSHRTKRGLWELKAGYTRDTTVTSEREDTGLVQAARRRNKWEGDLSWRYAITQRTNAKFGVEYTDVRFESSPVTRLFDYYNAQLYTTLTYDHTASDEFSFGLRAARFDVSDIDSDTDSYAAILGWRHDFSPVLQGNIKAGIRTSKRDFKQDGVNNDKSDTGAVLNASLTGETPLTTWEISLSRTPRPNGRGFLLQRDQLMLDVEHDISRRLSGRINGRLVDVESLDDSSNIADREYARGAVGLTWQLSRHWYLDGRYRYTWQKLQNRSNTAESNSVLITLTYDGDRRSL